MRCAPPNIAVWDVLGDFGSEHRWTKTLLHCARDTEVVAVGTTRTCTLPRPLMGRSQVREVLSEFLPGIALSYVLEGPAGPFATAQSRWSTLDTGGGTTVVTVEGRFTPRSWAVKFVVWPLVKPMIRRLTRSVLGELDAFVLSPRTRVHPSK